MATVMSARQAGDRLNLDHHEVIRRIRKGQIKAQKMGWSWLLQETDVEAVREMDWYKNVMKRRASAAV